jgi:hypothetical protein
VTEHFFHSLVSNLDRIAEDSRANPGGKVCLEGLEW